VAHAEATHTQSETKGAAAMEPPNAKRLSKIKPGIAFGALGIYLTEEQKKEITAAVIMRIHELHDNRLAADAIARLDDTPAAE